MTTTSKAPPPRGDSPITPRHQRHFHNPNSHARCRQHFRNPNSHAHQRGYTLLELCAVLVAAGVIAVSAAFFVGAIDAQLEQDALFAEAQFRAVELQREAEAWYLHERCHYQAEDANGNAVWPPFPVRATPTELRDGVRTLAHLYNFADGRLRVGLYVDGYSPAQHQALARRAGWQFEKNPAYANCVLISSDPDETQCVAVPTHGPLYFVSLPERVVLTPRTSGRTLRRAMDADGCAE